MKWAIVGGLLSALGYGIVIWAMGRAPLAHVSALRETSVILAAVIGTALLGEPFGRRRILAAVLVAAGTACCISPGEKEAVSHQLSSYQQGSVSFFWADRC